MFQRLVHEWGNKRKREPNDHNPVLEPRQIAYVLLPPNLYDEFEAYLESTGRK